jgi:hypothetical protein
MPALAQAEESDLAITAIKPYHYEWFDDYDIAKGSPWFNLKNYVGVTVENNRNATAESFEVTLYTDDEPIGSETMDRLPAYGVIDLTFGWMPEGEDPLSWTDTSEGAILSYTDTNKIYTLRAVVDEDGKVSEENEDNNELIIDQEVAWNGYMADAPLENYVHDTVKGGILYTTGDGQYRSGESGDNGTKYDTYYDLNYDLEIGDGAKLARFYIYYTWSKPKRAEEPKAPKMGVTLETPLGNSHELSMDKSYNDIKGDLPPPYSTYKYYAWGTYAYDITDYMKESGTYVVSVINRNDGSDEDFATAFSFAPPAILLVYEDTSAPEREYWINEGADILIGGRRGEAGFLDLDECLNEAEFRGEHLDLAIEEAVLGVVSPWADDSEDDVIEFNGRELGMGLYKGYYHDWSSSEDIKGISMTIGAGEAQIGIAAIDVTKYLEDYDNEVVQGDDGDNMMPVNAFLVITYKTSFDTGSPESPYPSISGTHNGTITVYQDITVNRMYTTPCPGTGGHSAFVKIWNETIADCAEARWDGYTDDYLNISFNRMLTLKKGVIYNYTIRTGSYPQIHHRDELEVANGMGIIRCTKFTDVNGKEYNNCIPAIKLYFLTKGGGDEE